MQFACLLLRRDIPPPSMEVSGRASARISSKLLAKPGSSRSLNHNSNLIRVFRLCAGSPEAFPDGLQRKRFPRKLMERANLGTAVRASSQSRGLQEGHSQIFGWCVGKLPSICIPPLLMLSLGPR